MNRKAYTLAMDKVKATDDFKEHTRNLLIDSYNHQSTNKKSSNRGFKLMKLASAFVLIIIIGISGAKLMIPRESMQNNPNNEIENIQSKPISELEKITFSYFNEGMGDGKQMAYDPNELIGDNPVAGKEKEITHLPVFKYKAFNESQMKDLAEDVSDKLKGKVTYYDYKPEFNVLIANCTTAVIYVYANGSYSFTLNDPLPSPVNIKEIADKNAMGDLAMYYYKKLSKLIIFDNPTAEVTVESYSFGGDPLYQTIIYDRGTNIKLESRLLKYSIGGVRLFISQEDGKLQSVDVGKMLSNAGVLYPIISPEEAINQFKKGNYATNVTNVSPDKAKIYHVELEYWSKGYQEYIQPVYKIIIGQDDWNEDSTKNCGMKEGLKVFGAVYVPAVSPEFVTIEKNEARFN